MVTRGNKGKQGVTKKEGGTRGTGEQTEQGNRGTRSYRELKSLAVGY